MKATRLDAVLATLPLSYPHDRSAVHVMFRGEHARGLIGRSDGRDIKCRELGPKVALTDTSSLPDDVGGWKSSASIPSTLQHHVVHVPLIRPREQMGRVHTRANVARVEDQLLGRHRTTEQFPSEAMSPDGDSVDCGGPVAAFQLSSDPSPAARTATHLPKESAQHDWVSGWECADGQRVNVNIVPSAPAVYRTEAPPVGRILQREVFAASFTGSKAWGHD